MLTVGELEALRATRDREFAAMEALANRVIERVIRRGFVDRADVRALRSQDAKCRGLVKLLEGTT